MEMVRVVDGVTEPLAETLGVVVMEDEAVKVGEDELDADGVEEGVDVMVTV